jgi:hypothetical protein
VRREAELHACDALVRGAAALCLEWRGATEKLVTQDAQGPQVDFLVVRFILDHLRRQVVERAA